MFAGISLRKLGSAYNYFVVVFKVFRTAISRKLIKTSANCAKFYIIKSDADRNYSCLRGQTYKFENLLGTLLELNNRQLFNSSNVPDKFSNF